MRKSFVSLQMPQVVSLRAYYNELCTIQFFTAGIIILIMIDFPSSYIYLSYISNWVCKSFKFV